MKEIGVDISHYNQKLLDQYLKEERDYVITVCDNTKETCPAFFGKVKCRLHIDFDDLSNVTGTKGFIWSEFRRVRDEIKDNFYKIYVEQIKPQL